MTLRELQPIILDAIRDAGYDGAKLTDTPHGLNMDSLDVIEAVINLEDALSRDIPEEWMADGLKNKTFAEIAELLANKLESENDVMP